MYTIYILISVMGEVCSKRE